MFWLEAVISGIIGIVLGVILQEPIKRFVDKVVRFFDKLFTTKKMTNEGFRFGNKETAVRFLDGNGRKEYESIEVGVVNDICDGGEFGEEVKYFYEATIAELDKEREEGHSKTEWDGLELALRTYSIGRSEANESMLLNLALARNTHFKTKSVITKLNDVCPLTNRRLKDYIEKYDFEAAGYYDLPNSIGVCLQVFTKDFYTIFGRRSDVCSYRAGEYDVSVVEAFRNDDIVNEKVDVWAVARRACCEELCELADNEMQIHLLGITFDKEYAQWNIIGVVNLTITCEELLTRRNSGVDGRWETKEINPVKNNLEDVIKDVVSHKIWDTGLATVYYSMLYQMHTRDRINKVIEKYQKK